jgi:hypothetical protein
MARRSRAAPNRNQLESSERRVTSLSAPSVPEPLSQRERYQHLPRAPYSPEDLPGRTASRAGAGRLAMKCLAAFVLLVLFLQFCFGDGVGTMRARVTLRDGVLEVSNSGGTPWSGAAVRLVPTHLIRLPGLEPGGTFSSPVSGGVSPIAVVTCARPDGLGVDFWLGWVH